MIKESGKLLLVYKSFLFLNNVLIKHFKNHYFLIFCLLLLFSCSNSSPKSFSIPEEFLQEGDIVFRCGVSVNSLIVRIADQIGSYSHIGIVVKDQNEWKVVHIVNGENEDSNGKEIIKIEPISQFFREDRSKAGSILRYDSTFDFQYKIAQKAIELSQQEIFFDHSYNLDDTTKLYCTELIYKIFLSLGVDITQERRSQFPGVKNKIIFPSDIFKNPHLKKIYSFKEE